MSDAAPQPRVAVVIPCFNAGQLLPEALASLQEPEPLEIVVVDDASTDPATLAAARRSRPPARASSARRPTATSPPRG